MNNRLKFRVWDTLAKRYIYPDSRGQGHYSMSLNGVFYNLQNGSGGKEYIVEQYTGLKDINDKDVYEGDILDYDFDGNSCYKEPRKHSLICNYDPSNAWYSFDKNIKSREVSYYWLEIKDSVTVIGNIMENPELLEK